MGSTAESVSAIKVGSRVVYRDAATRGNHIPGTVVGGDGSPGGWYWRVDWANDQTTQVHESMLALIDPSADQELLTKARDLRWIAEGEADLGNMSNDDLLALGIGRGVAGPLSDRQVIREAEERLAEIEGAPTKTGRMQRDPVEVLQSIADGLPTDEQWKSAANFAESVAGILSDSGYGHLRPERYPEDWR